MRGSRCRPGPDARAPSVMAPEAAARRRHSEAQGDPAAASARSRLAITSPGADRARPARAMPDWSVGEEGRLREWRAEGAVRLARRPRRPQLGASVPPLVTARPAAARDARDA